MKWRLLAVACGVIALGLLLYPLMGELVSEKYHSDVEAVYTAAIADTDNTELSEQRRAAEEYNALLRGEAAVCAGGASAPPMLYAGQLTVGGAMCTIDIPKIGVYLPVRHGTGAETLERAVGHVVGPSLPVGGAGTHAVNSMHHQAVRTPGEDILVSATAPDGTIEAIESSNGQIVGVQWHPEGLIHTAPEMNRLFADLVERSCRYREKR